MKKQVLGGIAVLAIAAVAAFNVNLNMNQKSDMSLLALANVEALAKCEDKVERDGGTIITTVCDRKTGALDRLFGICCGTEASSSCSYSNSGSC